MCQGIGQHHKLTISQKFFFTGFYFGLMLLMRMLFPTPLQT